MDKPPGKNPILIYALFFVLFLLLDRASYLYPFPGFNVTPWNPHPSLAIALLIFFGQRMIWLVYLAIITAEVLFRWESSTLTSALLAAAVLTLGYSAMATVIRAKVPASSSLKRRDDVVRLLAIIAIGCMISSLAYVLAIVVSRDPSEGALSAWLRFWIGDTVGIVVSLPIILMLINKDRRRQMAEIVHGREFLLQSLAVIASLVLVFSMSEAQRFKFFYLLFLPLIWIAVRHGLAGTAPAMVFLQVGVILGVIYTAASSLTVFELQTLLLALAIAGYFIAVMVDERQQISEDLQRTLKLAAAGEMAAAITHELNQPLTALSNYARACLAILENPDAAPRDALTSTLNKLSSEAMRAGDVIRRLRDLFKGGMQERSDGLINMLLEDTVLLFRERHRSVEFVMDITPRPLHVHVDPIQVALVLRNLLQNAVEAVNETTEKRIVTALREEDGYARVDVIDCGRGVPEELREKIFEPFFSDKLTGMGIGLSLSRTIIESHGGRVSVEAGQGGWFYFTLPLCEIGEHG